MLALKVFGQRDVDVKAAHRRFAGIAKRIAERFDNLERIAPKIITKASFDELRRHPEVIDKFPANVKHALNSYDSVNVFNVVRTMGALDVPNELILAYMISEKRLEEIMPTVGGSIVPVTQVDEIFVSGEPLCSRNVVDEIQLIRQQIGQLQQQLSTKLAQLETDQQSAFQRIETNLKDEVRDVGEAMRAWPLLINSFSYTRDFAQSMRGNNLEQGVAANITHLGNALFQTALSRELVALDDMYKSLPLGDLDLVIPSSIETLLSLTNNSIDPLVVFEPNATTFHTLIGRRWMLLNLNMTDLFTESQQIDVMLEMLFNNIQQRFQNVKLNALFKDTFPKNLVFNLIKGYTSSPEIEALKANLSSTVLAYFELSRSVLTAVEKIKTWWTMKLADIFENTLRAEVLTYVQRTNKYTAAVENLAASYDIVPTYKLFFTPEYSFQNNVVALFTLIKDMKGTTFWQFNSQFATTPYALNTSIEDLRDFGYVQQVIFQDQLKKMIVAVDAEAQTASSLLLARIYTDVRGFLSFARHFAKEIQPLLDAHGLVDIRLVSSNDPLLISFVGSDGLPKYAFFTLSNFWNIPNVQVIDAIKNYFAHVYLFRLFKKTRTIVNLDPSNRFYEFLSDLQTRFDAGGQLDLASIFEKAARPVFSDWNGYEFETAVAALNTTPPLTVDDLPKLKLFSILNTPTFVSSVMSNTIGAVIEQDPSVGTAVVPSHATATPDNMKQALKQVFWTLDTILGGNVSGAGDVVLSDTFVYRIDNRTSLSIYLAALWIYTKTALKDARYANWYSLDMWMYMIDHIDNHRDTTGLIGFKWADYGALKNTNFEPSNFVGEFDTTTFYTNFTPQYIINVDTFNEKSLESIILGDTQYYPNFKLNLWNSVEYYIQDLILSWLIPSQYQRHCALTQATSPHVWIDVKRTLFLFSDNGIAATLYAGLTSGVITPTSISTNENYSAFTLMIQNGIVFADLLFKDTNWKRLPFADIGKNAQPSQEISVDTFNGSLRDYNEFLMIYRQHTSQQYVTAFHLTKSSAFPVGLYYRSKAYAKSILDKQKLTLVDKDSIITPSILLDIFSDVFSKGVDAISEPLRNIIDNPATTLKQLELFLYVVASAGINASSNVFASSLPTIDPMSDVTAWNVRVALMFNQLTSESQAATSSAQSFNQRYARQVSTALFNASMEIKTAFANAIEAYNSVVIDGLVPREELIYGEDDLVLYESARAAIDAIFDLFFTISTSSVVSIFDHDFARSVFQAPFDVLSNTVLYKLEDQNENALKSIALFKTLILHLEVDELTEYNQLLQTAPAVYVNWFTEAILSRVFNSESWRERAIQFFQNVITATTFTIQKTAETTQNMRALVGDLGANYISPNVILRAMQNVKNPDLFFIYLNGSDLARIPTETPEFNLASLIVIALNNSGLLNTNIASISSYRSAAMPPPLFAISYILRTFSGMCGLEMHTGLQRFAIKEVKTNATVAQMYDRVINELDILKDIELLSFDRLVTTLVNTNRTINQLPRYHSVQVVWCMVLERLASTLELQTTSDSIQTPWFEYIQQFTDFQKETTLTTELGRMSLIWLVQHIFGEFENVLSSEDDKNNHYTIFVANNPLLTKHGIYRDLTLAIINAK